ncbi:MAG: beta-galactosidase [Paenibacillaceae bacterium]|nr:beta-galactosidase [Paenibacillaceae bacterium]
MGLKPTKIRSVMQPGQLTNITELGYGSIPMLEDNVARYEIDGNPKTPDYRLHKMLFQSYKKVLQRTGVDRIYNSFEDFCEECQEIHAIGNKLMLEAARINPDVAGIGVHALTDGDWVIGAGLLDIFGEPKKPYYTAKQIFANCYIAIRTKKANVYAGEPLQIALTTVNDEAAFSARITVEIQTDQGETVWAAKLLANVTEGIHELDAIEVDTSGWDGGYAIRVQLERDGKVIVENSYIVYAVKEERTRISDSRTVAVVETSPQLSGYLQSRNVNVVSFEPGLNTDIPVLVAAIPEEDGELFIRLQDWVSRGGKAIFLKMPSVSTQITRSGIHVAELAAGPIFPFALKLTPVRGFWNPANHVIMEHPIFFGLPSNCMMGQTYQNVYALTGILEPATDWIAGCILYDWYRGSKHRMNYLGLTEAYDAAEIIVVPHGSGNYVLSTLRLTENLGKDPIADAIVSNMIAWIV